LSKKYPFEKHRNTLSPNRVGREGFGMFTIVIGREQRPGESPNGKEILQDSRLREAVCKATCLKDVFQRNYVRPSCLKDTVLHVALRDLA